jgi:GT2 family glycosyltransferase
VPTRDRVGRLRRLLDSLRAQTVRDFEVIVVDDACTRGTPELLRREAERDPDDGRLDLRAVRREEPGGPARARNEGWRLARAPLVVFMDDDCTVTEDWLRELLEAADAAPGAIVQGRTVPNPAETGKLGPYSRSLRVEEPGPYYQGTNILYPRELLKRLGGFDADSFPGFYGEDTDLAWRAIELGTPVEWAPRALVHHAVFEVGPLATLRIATRWTQSIQIFKRHPALRGPHLTYGVFWKGSHYLLVRALLALLLRRRSRMLALWLGAPYVRHLLIRGERDGGGARAAPFYLVHDLVEMVTVLRGALRYRTPVI